MLTATDFRLAANLPLSLANIWYPHIVAAMTKYQINTPIRQAHFLAQVGHESLGFKQVRESLNYAESALVKMFPRRITASQARMYGRNLLHPANQPMIGNIIYANRNGNGDIASGDGYRYRGRGLLQVTGRSNYAAMSAELNEDLITHPELLTGHELAAASAAAWWRVNGLNELADSDDVSAVTRRVNGGTNGITDRCARLITAKSVLCPVAS